MGCSTLSDKYDTCKKVFVILTVIAMCNVYAMIPFHPENDNLDEIDGEWNNNASSGMTDRYPSTSTSYQNTAERHSNHPEPISSFKNKDLYFPELEVFNFTFLKNEESEEEQLKEVNGAD